MNVHAAEFTPNETVAAGNVGNELEDVETIVQSLKWMFPSFSARALTELYVTQCQKSFSKAIDTICAIEAEVEGTTLQRLTNASQARDTRPTEQAAKHGVIDPDDFPCLGSRDASQAPSGSGMFVGTVDFASKVKMGSHAGSKMQSKANAYVPHQKTEASTAARPIWESEPHTYKQFGTGIEVASQYEAHRGDARSYAIARNTLFEEATRAFLAGDKKLAKELGEKGRHYNMLMKQCHSKAAHAIYGSRNTDSQSWSDGMSGNPILDLHGLHVNEAQSILEKTLDEYKRQGTITHVDVVVGEGKHSKGPKQHSRLRHGVIQYLTMAGFRYKEQYMGLITVIL